MLIALVNAARVQTLHLLSLSGLEKHRSEFILCFDGLLKQSRPGSEYSRLHLKAYPPDRRLCVYMVLKEYLKRTKLLRQSTEKLFISYVKPHKAVSRDTISQWIKVVMLRAGINTDIFTALSVRSASTSKAKMLGVPISLIMQTAGWSNHSTFAKFYDKEVINRYSMATAVLKV